MSTNRIQAMAVAKVYPLYLAKIARKGRSQAELDAVIAWLTGHDAASLAAELERGTGFGDFFAEAPSLNPARLLVTGTICGVRVEEITDPLMREVRILDKLVDELARGRPMDKILRGEGTRSASGAASRRPA